MSTFMMHCGGRVVTPAELQAIPLPEKTQTYEPVPFIDLLTNTKKICDDLLGMEYVGEKLAVSGKDQRFFGLLQYRDNIEDKIGHAIGIRSSYDKSMSNGFCSGATIFVCDNMAFTGDVTYMRKHTKNVWNDLEEKLVSVIYNTKNKFIRIVEDAYKMADTKIDTNDAYSFIGRAIGHKVLQARQAQNAFKHWNNAPYDDFKSKNVWSLYNACTEALKSTTPNKILERHIDLHDRTISDFGLS